MSEGNRLAWARCLDGRDIQEFQHFGSALFFHSNRFHKMPPFRPALGHEQAQRLKNLS